MNLNKISRLLVLAGLTGLLTLTGCQSRVGYEPKDSRTAKIDGRAVLAEESTTNGYLMQKVAIKIGPHAAVCAWRYVVKGGPTTKWQEPGYKNPGESLFDEFSAKYLDDVFKRTMKEGTQNTQRLAYSFIESDEGKIVAQKKLD